MVKLEEEFQSFKWLLHHLFTVLKTFSWVHNFRHNFHIVFYNIISHSFRWIYSQTYISKIVKKYKKIESEMLIILKEFLKIYWNYHLKQLHYINAHQDNSKYILCPYNQQEDSDYWKKYWCIHPNQRMRIRHVLRND